MSTTEINHVIESERLPIEAQESREALKGVQRMFMLATCFLTGFSIMALELLGFRMFAPYFGSSIYVTGSLIGIILTALSAGYFLGGRLIDRWPSATVVMGAVLIAAAYLFLMLWLHPYLLESFASLEIAAGSLLATLVIFAIPMTLLSTASPAILKLVAGQNALGTSAGNIFGISTAGSIIGSFAAPFILIPGLGVRVTFAAISIVLLVLAVTGMVGFGRKKAVLAVVFLVFCLLPQPSESDEVIFRTESSYSRLTVLETESGQRMLEVGSGWLSSITPFEDGLAHTVFDSFLVGPIITEPENALILGMGAGTSVKQIQQFFPDCRIDAVDIDPEVVRIAGKYFDLHEGPKLKIHVEDARRYLRNCDRKYDFIEIDLFHQGPYVPFYAVTREFFVQISQHLTEKGCLVFNVFAPAGDDDLLEPIGATIKEVFPSVFRMRAVSRGRDGEKKLPNVCLIAMKSEIDLDVLRNRIFRPQADPRLSELSEMFYRNIERFDVAEGTKIFTDDRAPVEKINYRVVSRYLQNNR